VGLIWYIDGGIDELSTITSPEEEKYGALTNAVE
jgi:hypothetical protein